MAPDLFSLYTANIILMEIQRKTYGEMINVQAVWQSKEILYSSQPQNAKKHYKDRQDPPTINGGMTLILYCLNVLQSQLP